METDLDFMYLLEYRPGGFLSDWLCAYDRPARVWQDAATGEYVAEQGHDVSEFAGRVVRYKQERLIVKRVETAEGAPARISAEPINGM